MNGYFHPAPPRQADLGRAVSPGGGGWRRGTRTPTPALQTFAVPTGLSRPAAPCASSRPAHVAWCHPIRTAVVPGADFLLIHGAPTLAPRCAAALVRSLT